MLVFVIKTVYVLQFNVLKMIHKYI